MAVFDAITREVGGEPITCLCLGAHADDIEIGAGGTILRLLKECPGAAVHWVVFSGCSTRREEARASAAFFLEGSGQSHVLIKDFRESYFPFAGAEIKEFFEELKGLGRPHIIFTHRRADAHQDHRLISRLTWNTFRDSLILEYEVPKYDGDLGRMNFYVALDDGTGRAKVSALVKFFRSQTSRHWFSEDTFYGLLRLRGIEAATKYAEAFFCNKFVWR